MAISQTLPSTAHSAATTKRSWIAVLWFLAALALIGVIIAYYARKGAVSPRIANPAAAGGIPPRPVEFASGRADTAWIIRHQVGCVVMMLTLIAACVRTWIRQPGHPFVLMILAATLIVWQDPIMNWAPYAVYNPQLWHFPEDWFLAKMSPTVEPFVVIGYSTFYFIAPFFSSLWILRLLQRRASGESFVWRHPLVCMGLLCFVTGFAIDAALEIFCVSSGLYIYSQVIPWGSLYAGTTFQFPLIWESSLVTVVMIPAGVLCYRDDTGRTQAEKLAQRFRWFPNRPALGTFAMMAIILNLAYFVYGAGFGIIRASKLATSVACPYPWTEAKVYDPNGFYEREGQPGPYFEGHWNTWMSAQPNGRPAENPVKEDGYCRPARA